MTKPTPTPAWLVERLAQGELDPATAAEVRARLAAEGHAPDEVLAALAAANRAFLAGTPKEKAAAAIRSRLARTAPPRRQPLIWLLPVAGVAVAAVLMIGRLRPGAGAPGDVDIEETRDKGEALKSPRLVVYRQRDGGNERLHNGTHADRGDRVQLAYITRDAGFGLILSLDGSGRVTLHLPEESAAAAATLQTAGEVNLPTSYELDDAPAFERFFLITARESFAVAPVVQAVRALATSATAETAALALPPGFTQTSLRLDKRRKEKP
jgi:hypothetical protein